MKKLRYCFLTLIFLFILSACGNGLKSIEINTHPEIFFIDATKLNEIKVKVNYKKNSKIIDLTEEMVDSDDLIKFSTPGSQVINITYQGKKTEFTQEVRHKEVSSIRVLSYPEKLIATKINLSEIKIEVTYTSAEIITVGLLNEMLSIADREKFNQPGAHTVVIKYEGQSTTFPIFIYRENKIPENQAFLFTETLPGEKHIYLGGNISSVQFALNLDESLKDIKITAEDGVVFNLSDNILKVTYVGANNISANTKLLTITYSDGKDYDNLEINDFFANIGYFLQPDKSLKLIEDFKIDLKG